MSGAACGLDGCVEREDGKSTSIDVLKERWRSASSSGNGPFLPIALSCRGHASLASRGHETLDIQTAVMSCLVVPDMLGQTQ
jgi:hypothetical protein